MLVQRKSPKKHPPGGAPSGPPALRVREQAAGFAEWTSVSMQRTGAHPARHPADFSSARSPRHMGPRLGGILPQNQEHEPRAKHALSLRSVLGVGQGWPDSWLPAPSRCRASQATAEIARQGRAHDARASAVGTRVCYQPTPPAPGSAPGRAAAIDPRGAARHRARRLAFCLLLGNAKSRPLLRRRSGSSCFAPTNKTQKSKANAGFQLALE